MNQPDPLTVSTWLFIQIPKEPQNLKINNRRPLAVVKRGDNEERW